VHAFDQAVICSTDFLFGRPRFKSEDFKSLSGAHLAGLSVLENQDHFLRMVRPSVMGLLP
jgi:hypothetical protein